LAHDVGEALGCGGHLTYLRRTAVGSFTLAQARPLAELTIESAPTHLLPPEKAIPEIPAVILPEMDIQALLNGQQIEARQPAAPQMQLQDIDGNFYGVIRLEGQMWRAEKMFHAV
jgi:tRNA pseudouridine55 synthase